MFPPFVVTDILLHRVYEIELIILFHCIPKREALIGTYVSCIKQVMYLVEGSIMKLVYFVEPVHNFLCEGCVRVDSVLW